MDAAATHGAAWDHRVHGWRLGRKPRPDGSHGRRNAEPRARLASRYDAAVSGSAGSQAALRPATRPATPHPRCGKIITLGSRFTSPTESQFPRRSCLRPPRPPAVVPRELPWSSASRAPPVPATSIYHDTTASLPGRPAFDPPPRAAENIAWSAANSATATTPRDMGGRRGWRAARPVGAVPGAPRAADFYPPADTATQTSRDGLRETGGTSPMRRWPT